LYVKHPQITTPILIKVDYFSNMGEFLREFTQKCTMSHLENITK